MNTAEQSVTLTIVGLSCGQCKAAIERALHQLNGVHEVNADVYSHE
jgi:copper chaperone CopZ